MEMEMEKVEVEKKEKRGLNLCDPLLCDPLLSYTFLRDSVLAIRSRCRFTPMRVEVLRGRRWNR